MPYSNQSFTQCVWFREDLRTQDHQGLIQAIQQAKIENSGCLAVYILTPKTWQKHDKSLIQLNLVLEKLRELAIKLSKLNIPLKILKLETFEQVPKALKAFAEKFQIKNIYASRYYGWDERVRDQACEKLLKSIGVKITFRHGFVVFKPEDVLKADGTPYQVFTPYKRAWIQKFLSVDLSEKNHAGNLVKLEASGEVSDLIPDFMGELEVQKMHQDWALTEEEIHQELKKFLHEQVLDYKNQRDFPSIDEGTSRLSPYLSQGMISPKQILKALMLEYLDETKGDFLKLLAKPGIETFVGELIWRDFYQMILFHYPQVSKHQPFKLKTNQIPWTSGAEGKALFKAWCEGKTGFPIVDAAMRCLNQTGFMHNRLRMVTAMFMSKLLLLDWRWGEAYFMENLIDGELGANNGGWQWCASTGTDAVPYFRIFNPTSQSEKFDSEGEFIRQYLPELKTLSAKQIHNPDLASREKLNYPKPIIDYRAQRARALKLFAV